VIPGHRYNSHPVSHAAPTSSQPSLRIFPRSRRTLSARLGTAKPSFRGRLRRLADLLPEPAPETFIRGTLRINSSTPRTMESKPSSGQTSARPPARQAHPVRIGDLRQILRPRKSRGLTTLRSIPFVLSGLEEMIKHHPAWNQSLRPKTGVGGGCPIRS
jgi:hypothetical protein